PPTFLEDNLIDTLVRKVWRRRGSSIWASCSCTSAQAWVRRAGARGSAAAALHLAQGEVAAAVAALEPVLTNFAPSFDPVQRPQEPLLIAYRILAARRACAGNHSIAIFVWADKV
ncbi:MAG: hypothetical protein ACOYNY_13885, partial [Caldilineaceae bacterium]